MPARYCYIMHGAVPSDEPYDVVIVGAGISGIGLAAHLARRCPGKRYLILDRRQRIGGTWDLFRYPGVRSDSDMYTLGYGFEPWRDGRSIADGEAIREYLEGVATKYGVAENIRFGQQVISAGWDSQKGQWAVRSRDADGVEEEICGRFLFFGSGYYDYDDPYDAEIPGIEDFEGATIHPQFWPADIDLKEKRVVVVGSGATAATIVPALADKAAHVTMLQRTPSWYISHPSRDPVARYLRRVLPERAAYALIRALNVRLQNHFIKRSRGKPDQVSKFLTNQIKKRLDDSFDLEAFSPPYNPWEQRLCLIPDGDLFSAIRNGNASIVTGRIERVDATGIKLKDGRHVEADFIVTATGLQLVALGKVEVSMDGAPVHFPDHFYYRNCMFSNVPNLAALFGYLNAAWTLRVEMVADWLCHLFEEMDARGAEIVTPVLPENHELEEEDAFWGFTSGYLQRGRHLIPKSATTQPWRLGQDYLEDRKEMRKASFDDGFLHFAKQHAATSPR